MSSKENSNILILIVRNFKSITDKNKKNIFYLIYYSILEAFLLMIAPLMAAVIINSVLAHATFSIYVLSFIVIITFFGITVLQVINQYIIEKFEQQIFVQEAIKTAQASIALKENATDQHLNKYMNYFFDVLSIQKLFPTLLLNAVSLIVKLMVSLLLLLIFDLNLFLLGIFFIISFSIIMFFLGKGGINFSIKRSDAKHEAIYFLQNIPKYHKDTKKTFHRLDYLLIRFVHARTKMFKVVIRQLSLTFFMEGLIMSSFFILGGYLVFEAKLPIGEFVAAEILIVSLTYAFRDFMKQIDYIYDMIEGFYKLNKLSKKLGA